MNCPDKEQLMLYVDGELDTTSTAEIKTHLHTCNTCRHEVELFEADLQTESLLRNKVNLAFQKRTQNKQIMKAIMAEPRPKSVNSTNKTSFWSKWLVRLMVPALAIAIALFVLLTGSPSQSPETFKGNAYRISIMANNDQNKCFVDGELYTAKNSFEVTADSFKKLEGDFLVNVVTVNDLYSFNVNGKTSLSFDLTTMTPVFNDCKANITLVNGESATAKINGKRINISKFNPVELADKKESDSIKPSSVENTKTEEKPKAKVEVKVIATPTVKLDDTKEQVASETQNNEEQEMEAKAVEITGFGAENLTQEQIDDISLIGSPSEDVPNEPKSPFSGGQIKSSY